MPIEIKKKTRKDISNMKTKKAMSYTKAIKAISYAKVKKVMNLMKTRKVTWAKKDKESHSICRGQELRSHEVQTPRRLCKGGYTKAMKAKM